MKLAASILAVGLMSAGLIADDRNVEFDERVDFAKFRTFALRDGQITAQKPELNNPLVRTKIADSIRAQLVAKGLAEAQGQPDLIVNFRFGAADQREIQTFPAGRRGRQTRVQAYKFTQGTLIVDLTARESRNLVWRGIYRDDESNPAKISEKLPDDIRKLFSEYPPRKK